MKKPHVSMSRLSFALIISIALVFSVLLILPKITGSPTTSPTASPTASSTTPATLSQPETITVSAAASLTTGLTEIQKQFEASNQNIKVQFNFGGSGALKKQIIEGAPVDLFIAADTKSIDDLNAKSLIVQKSKINILGNDLVLLVRNSSKDSVKTIKDLVKSSVDYISLGTPESVPAGAYGKESLTFYKLFEPLSPKLVYGKDVKQVMTYVETGDAAAGFVYATDAKLAKDSFVAQILPAESHSPILYSAAIIANSTHEKSAQQFLDYLTEEDAQAIFEKYGFTLLER